MGKIDNNKKQKEDALLNTAFDLFTRQGIHKTVLCCLFRLFSAMWERG